MGQGFFASQLAERPPNSKPNRFANGIVIVIGFFGHVVDGVPDVSSDSFSGVFVIVLQQPDGGQLRLGFRLPLTIENDGYDRGAVV
jgi:hypothetical protein